MPLLYGIGIMVKDHSERRNPLPPHGLLFPINSKGFFYMHIPDRIVHTTACVTPVVDHSMERAIAQLLYTQAAIRNHAAIAPHCTPIVPARGLNLCNSLKLLVVLSCLK